MPSSRGSSRSRDWSHIFLHWQADSLPLHHLGSTHLNSPRAVHDSWQYLCPLPMPYSNWGVGGIESQQTLTFFKFPWNIIIKNAFFLVFTCLSLRKKSWISFKNRSQTWTPRPPPSPQHLCGSSPCTSPKHAVSCVRHRLAIQFLHDSIHVRMPFSQIIPRM